MVEFTTLTQGGSLRMFSPNPTSLQKEQSVAETKPSHYNGGDIQVLEGLEPVRKRPGIEGGSTSARGRPHLA